MGKKGRGPKSEPPADREAKTPNQTGSFAVFHKRATAAALRFSQIAAVKERVLDYIDIEGPHGSKEMRKLQYELEDMAKRFEAWPTMNAETVALERPILVNRLMDLSILCKEIALKLPLPPEEFDGDPPVGAMKPVKRSKPPPKR